jgi:hypothetical protein
LFNREGDCLAAKLRPGNVHSADGWEDMLLPEIERQQGLRKEVVFRADAAFAKPEIYEALEERGVKHAIRIPSNDSLERDISELLTRPVGRPGQKPVVWYKGFLYQAASWKTARREELATKRNTRADTGQYLLKPLSVSAPEHIGTVLQPQGPPPDSRTEPEFRISCRVLTASPPRLRSAKPAIMRVFYPGTDSFNGAKQTEPCILLVPVGQNVNSRTKTAQEKSEK